MPKSLRELVVDYTRIEKQAENKDISDEDWTRRWFLTSEAIRHAMESVRQGTRASGFEKALEEES